MKIKYRDKEYSSEDIPLFLYFKDNTNKDLFMSALSKYKTYPNFKKAEGLMLVIAGKHILKDKRAKFFFSFEFPEERIEIQKHVFIAKDETNGIVCAPPDIGMNVIQEWIQSNIKHLR